MENPIGKYDLFGKANEAKSSSAILLLLPNSITCSQWGIKFVAKSITNPAAGGESRVEGGWATFPPIVGWLIPAAIFEHKNRIHLLQKSGFDNATTL